MRLSLFVPNRPVHCNVIRDILANRGFVIQVEYSNALMREIQITLSYDAPELGYYVKGVADGLCDLFSLESKTSKGDIEAAICQLGPVFNQSDLDIRYFYNSAPGTPKVMRVRMTEAQRFEVGQTYKIRREDDSFFEVKAATIEGNQVELVSVD